MSAGQPTFVLSSRLREKTNPDFMYAQEIYSVGPSAINSDELGCTKSLLGYNNPSSSKLYFCHRAARYGVTPERITKATCEYYGCSWDGECHSISLGSVPTCPTSEVGDVDNAPFSRLKFAATQGLVLSKNIAQLKLGGSFTFLFGLDDVVNGIILSTRAMSESDLDIIYTGDIFGPADLFWNDLYDRRIRVLSRPGLDSSTYRLRVEVGNCNLTTLSIPRATRSAVMVQYNDVSREITVTANSKDIGRVVCTIPRVAPGPNDGLVLGHTLIEGLPTYGSDTSKLPRYRIFLKLTSFEGYLCGKKQPTIFV